VARTAGHWCGILWYVLRTVFRSRGYPYWSNVSLDGIFRPT